MPRSPSHCCCCGALFVGTATTCSPRCRRNLLLSRALAILSGQDPSTISGCQNLGTQHGPQTLNPRSMRTRNLRIDPIQNKKNLGGKAIPQIPPTSSVPEPTPFNRLTITATTPSRGRTLSITLPEGEVFSLRGIFTAREALTILRSFRRKRKITGPYKAFIKCACGSPHLLTPRGTQR